jgi:tetratricopeptide (TPR) repeat protein
MRGEFERAIEICGQGLELCAGDPDVGVESMGFNLFAFFHAIRAGAAAYLGRGSDAVAEIAEIDTPAGRKHSFSFHVCGMFRPYVDWLTGDYRAGLAHIRQAIDGFGPGAPLSTQVNSQHTLGIALSLVEEWDEADAAFTRALEIARAAGSYLHLEAETLAWLGRCAGERGEFEHARALVDASEAAAERIGVRLTEALVPFARARILWRERGAAASVEIERELAACLAAARELGIRLLEAAVWLERAALAEALEQSVERRAHLQTAHALWLEMGSERNAERLERMLGG